MSLLDQISDENLRLAIIEGLVDYPDLGGDPDGDDEHAYTPDPFVRAALLDQVRVEDTALSQITSLSWSAGLDIQFAICSQWDGEDDFFDIQTLQGIGALSALTELFIQLRGFTDLEPLTALPDLATLVLSGMTHFDSLAPLLKLPALKRVELDASAPDVAQVREALIARGVQVRLPDPPRRSMLP
jgi:hypothetical protein